MSVRRIRNLLVLPVVTLFLLPAGLAAAPASATGIKLPKYSGPGPGEITCALSFDVAFAPPLTNAGGGTGASAVSAGRLSGCTATTTSVTITSAKATGSFASSPLTCAGAVTSAAETFAITWKGTVNGAVSTAPDPFEYGGTAKFAATQAVGATATGSFAGPVTLALNPPDSATVAAGCASSKGLKKIAMSATLTLGVPTPPTVLPTSWWTPPPGNLPWQWELDHALVLTKPSDMGTGDLLPDGQPAPDPVVYDIDGIDNPASTVAALHARGDHVICYVEVGSAGNYYSAGLEGLGTTYFNQFKAAGVLGARQVSYPEYFLNIDSPATLDIVEHMIAQQCYAKGFDAVETDLDETYGTNEGPTGFTITQADEQSYLTTLASFMHTLGLGWIAKNLDDTGDSFATTMEPVADGMLTEQCNQYGSCGALSAYFGQKAIFNAEYAPENTGEFCATDNAADFNGALFPVSLNGGRHPCR